MLKSEWFPLKSRSRSSHYSINRKSFAYLQNMQVKERRKSNKLSFQECANLLYMQAPLHSLKAHQPYRQTKLKRRTKIITLPESSVYPKECGRDGFLSLKRIDVGNINDSMFRTKTQGSYTHKLTCLVDKKPRKDYIDPPIAKYEPKAVRRSSLIQTLSNTIIRPPGVESSLHLKERSMLCGWQNEQDHMM